MKINNKGFCRYVGQKRKIKGSVPSLINKTGELMTTYMEKAVELNKFVHQCSLEITLPTHLKSLNITQGRDWGNEVPSIVKEDQV